ncbi:MAG: Mur ligase domain-containing protein [Nitrosomonadales bacterium]
MSSDSRAIATGDLFVALKGENFDGGEFIGMQREAVRLQRWLKSKA